LKLNVNDAGWLVKPPENERVNQRREELMKVTWSSERDRLRTAYAHAEIVGLKILERDPSDPAEEDFEGYCLESIRHGSVEKYCGRVLRYVGTLNELEQNLEQLGAQVVVRRADEQKRTVDQDFYYIAAGRKPPLNMPLHKECRPPDYCFICREFQCDED
jgi:hypothetical protein